MRAHRIRFASLASLLLLGATAAACRREASGTEDPRGPGADAYVQVMAELMFLDAGPPEGITADAWEASLDSLRAEILAAHGVTASEILEFAGTAGGEAGRMEALWKDIAQKYDSMRVERLRVDTEARSELEGKLGRDAPVEARTESASPTTGHAPPGRTLMRQRPGSRPATRDTAAGSN